MEDQFTQFGDMDVKIAKLNANLKTMQEANFASEPGRTEPCEISGTETYNATETSTEYGFRVEWEYVYDNCVVSTWNVIDGMVVNRRTKNGSVSGWSDYSNDGEISMQSSGTSNNYIEVLDNNETEMVSRTSTYQNTYETSTEENGTSYRMTYKEDGISSQVDINASGTTVYSEKEVAENFSVEDYTFDEGSAGSITLNGGLAYYEDGVALESQYFDNYVYEWTRMNNEKTVIINGTAGSLCLGGSVSVETTSTMKENQVDYFSATSDANSDVLPYLGGVSLTGANSITATVAFAADESNNTSATVTIGTNEPDVYTSWSDMTAESTCSVNINIID